MVPLIVALILLFSFGVFLFYLRTSARRRRCDGGKDTFIHSYFGISEAWLNAYALSCAILIFYWDLQITKEQEEGDACSLQQRILSTDPVQAFASLFVGAYTVTNQISGGSHAHFYNWFHKSELDIANRRGYGARGYDLFGIIPQTWIPRLSISQFLWLSLLQTWNLYLAWAGGIYHGVAALHFVVAFFIALLRHSMLFAENNAGMHKPVLLPAAFWYLAFSPQLWNTVSSDDAVGMTEALWPTSFLKIHIISTYFASGMGKVIVTWKQGKWNWANGTNMQYYLFVAGFARPGRNGSALSRIGRLIQCPLACVILGIGGLGFELGTPMALLGGHWCFALFVVALLFHYGIYYLQGIDFTGQWVPCLLVFLVDQNPVQLFPRHGFKSSTRFELLCWGCGALFLVCQLFCAFTMREVTVPNSNKGGMPWSCMHMFTINSNIFGDDFASWYTLMSGDQRASGHLGIMEWSGPIFVEFNMSKEDMNRLPFKVVWFGHTMCKHKFLEGLILSEYQNKRFLIFSNFEMSPELKKVLQEICQMIEPKSNPNNIRDRKKLEELVALQRKAVNVFNADSAEPARRGILMRGESFLFENLEDKRPE